MTRVAVLGCGRMGSAMARSIHGRGHELVLYNRSPDKAEALATELGARTVASPAEAVREVDVAITMLADRSAVEDVCGSDEGIVDGAHDGLVVVDMSTVEPEVARALEPLVRARGGALLDAPVSGSVGLAESGQLTVMVGGDPEALERARPVLDAVATRITHVGPIGAGAAMKLAVNTVIFALDVGLSEALVLAERAGIERSTAYDVFQASAAGAPFVGYKRAAFLEPETAPTAFALDLAAKDLRLITALGDALGVPVAQARINLDLVLAAAAAQGGDRDFALVAEHLRTGRARAAAEPVGAGRREGRA